MLTARFRTPTAEFRFKSSTTSTFAQRPFQQPKELPGGTYWLSKQSTDCAVLYGQNFVLQRPKLGGPGLVLSPQSKLGFLKTSGNTQLAGCEQNISGPPAIRNNLWEVTDITDYTFLGEAGILPALQSPFLLPAGSQTLELPAQTTDCTEIIIHPTLENRAEEPLKNPRRTWKVKFTCKLCDTTSLKRVSPHGWTSGSVFARCEGCNVVHKLVDNLKIFHEFKGSVFPAAQATVKIPEGLPQKPSLDYHVHPAIYPLLPEED